MGNYLNLYHKGTHKDVNIFLIALYILMNLKSGSKGCYTGSTEDKMESDLHYKTSENSIEQ